MGEFKNKHFDNKQIPARYVNRFIGLNSLEEFGKYGLFPNVKEVTESFGMYHAVTQWIGGTDPDIFDDDTNVYVIVVGDGKTPRTAALFAFMTKWQCCSIDPALEGDYEGIRRLDIVPERIEDAKIKPTDDGINIIVMPHAHVEPQVAWNKLANDRTWLVNMPCCVHGELSLPAIQYRDHYIASPKNYIRIYSNYCKPKFNKNG